jgi:hypothetical protein
MTKVPSTSSSESGSLRRFGLKCVLFFVPLAAILGVATGALYIVGELTTPVHVLELQKSGPVIYDPMYQPKSDYPAYKVLGTIQHRPDVLALGTSRIFQIRHEFIRESEAPFYNGYMFAARLGAMRQFLERTTLNPRPHVLILDLEGWWFREDAPVAPETGYFQSASQMQILDFAWRNGLYLATQRWAMRASRNLIGGSARLHGSGLRADGSFFANERFLDAVPNLLETQLSGVRQGTDERFMRGSPQVSQQAVEEVQKLLNYCSAHHIVLIGYLSTYHPSLYQTLRDDPRHAYLWQIAPVLEPMFRQSGAAFFDFQDPAVVGCPAAEYLDVNHESDVCTTRLLVAMAGRDPRAASVFDSGKLQGFLSQRRSEWQLGF